MKNKKNIFTLTLTILTLSCITLSSINTVKATTYSSLYDVNQDNMVDLLDLTYFAFYLNGDYCPNDESVFDISGNGLISYKDMDMLINYIS